MRRYEIVNGSDGLELNETNDGVYVFYEEAQQRIDVLEKALKPVKEAIDNIDHADGSNWDDPTWNENYTLNIGLRVSEIRLILQALKQ